MPGDSPLVSAFRQARHYTPGPRTKGPIRLVVIHDMEFPERPTGAEWCMDFFATTPKVASAHYSVDNNSICQSVHESDIAYHAPGANHDGIGIEHAGYAAQSRAQWDDEYSRSELRLSARLTAELCARYHLPVHFVDASGLIAGYRGITTHREVTNAYRRSTHTDPGPNFPMGQYLRWVDEASEEEDMFDAKDRERLERIEKALYKGQAGDKPPIQLDELMLKEFSTIREILERIEAKL
jgi:N-acetyl-anhydromuramyl-L-alanine amidase AmpD